jgi:hypothetical protein
VDKLKIKWSQRLPLNKLRQLYLSQASGLLDEELLEDVAVTLYLRCKDIIAVDKSRHGEVRCPFCYENKLEEVYIQVNRDEYGKELDKLQCGECFNEFSHAEYKRCHKGEQLNMGGAGEAFRRFINEYERPALPEKRMLQVDRLIHEFHYNYYKSNPNVPTRSVGPNLLGANLTESMKFLNELSGIVGDDVDLKSIADNWQKEKKKFNEIWNWEI